MKKVLLATTVLVAGASIASAEITLSGDARMGISNGFAAPGAFDPTTFTSRARVMFTMSGESDSGLAFGASFRANDAVGAASGTAGSVFISGAFGKLSMGDVDGAANAAVGHVDGVGLTGLGDLNESLFVGNGGLASFGSAGAIGAADLAGIPALAPGFTMSALTSDPSVLYEYSMGSVSFYASATLPGYRGSFTDGTVLPATATSNFDGDAYALGVAYTIDNYKVSLGYESVSVEFIGLPAAPAVPPVELGIDHLIIGGDATFGAVTLKARYGQADIDVANVAVADVEQASLSAAYKMDALTLTGFYSTLQSETPAGVNIINRDAIGIGAAYDLGGGAVVTGGVVQRETQVGIAAAQKDTAFDLGIGLTF